MPSQWVFRITLLSLAIKFSHQQDTADCSFSDNCDTDENDAHVICADVPGDPLCECLIDPDDPLVGVTCGDLTTDLATLTAADMDATKCGDLCSTSATCMFWKYKSIGEGTLWAQKNCFLMNKDQCQAAEDSTCEAPTCAGGNQEGAGSVTTTCEVRSCPGPIKTIDGATPTDFVQKWECYIGTDDTRAVTEFDMYAVDATMPLGGFCKLNTDDGGSCKPTVPEFRFDCTVDPGDNTAKWMKASAGIDDTDVVDVDGYLQDIDCSAPRLVFTADGLVTQSGRDIHCLNGGVDEEGSGADAITFIPAENDCLMTCDDYSVLLFYTDYDKDSVDGGRAWFWEVFGVTMNPVKMEDADMLDCWG